MSHFLLLASIITNADVSPDIDSIPATEIVDSAIARADAIVSGTIDFIFSFHVMPRKNRKPNQSDPLSVKDGKSATPRRIPFVSDSTPADDSSLFSEEIQLSKRSTSSRELANTRYEITFSGDDWKLTYPGYKTNSRLSRNGFSATMSHSQSQDGSPDKRNLDLGDSEKSIDSGMFDEKWKRIFRCGVIPYPQVVAYIHRERDQVIDGGVKDVKGIACRALEWKLSTKDLIDIAYGFGTAGLVRDGGILRLYVAPELSFATPLVEFIDIDGRIHSFYEGADYIEVSEGLYFPKHSSRVEVHLNEYRVTEFLVHDISGINQPVEESEFSIEVPEGTRVSDSRTGKGNVKFVAGKNLNLTDADKFIQSGLPPNPLLKKDADSLWNKHILIGLNVVLVIAIVLVFGYRKWKTTVRS